MPSPILTSELHSLTLHPVTRVPPEIWTEIFKHACDLYIQSTAFGSITPETKEPDSLSSKNPLHVIRWVNHNWRAIIQSMPGMWSNVSLHDCWALSPAAQADLPGVLSGRARIVTEILQFSRNRPLTITVYLPLQSHAAILVHPLMFILVQHSHRWTHLCIREDAHNSVTQAFTSSISLLKVCAFPLLEHIGTDWTGSEKDHSFSFGFGTNQALKDPLKNGLPKLRSLSVAGSLRLKSLPWAQLEVLDVKSVMDSSDIARLLPFLTSLVSFSLSWGNFPLIDMSDMGKVQILPKLETLFVSVWDYGFFYPFRTPKLRILKIGETEDADDLGDIATFIARSRCSITEFSCPKLRINRTSAQSQSVLKFLRSLSNVQVLRLTFADCESPVIDCVLNLLGAKNGNQLVLCPMIREIDIVFDFLSHIPSFVKLVDMIEVRWEAAMLAGGSGLDTVSGIPQWHEPWPKEYWVHDQRLEEMAGDGLEVHDGPCR